MPAFFAQLFTTFQTTFSVRLSPQAVPARHTRRKILPLVIPAAHSQLIESVLDPIGHRDRSRVGGLPDEVDDGPMFFSSLNV